MIKKITPDTILAYSYKGSDTVLLCKKDVLPLSATYRVATMGEVALYKRGITSYKMDSFLNTDKKDDES